MLMQGLFCFFFSRQVKFQSCFVKFTSFVVSFFFFAAAGLIFALQLVQQ